MNLYNSAIVTTKYDVLWDDISALTDNALPKPVLVIINEYKPGSNEEEQLKKMLEVEKSCNLRPEQYNIIFLKEGQMAAWHQIREALDPKIILLFGILPTQLGIASLFALNAPNNFDNRVWIPTHQLSAIEQNTALKSLLWNGGMKPIFKDNRPNFL
jgi:hypothetical protein